MSIWRIAETLKTGQGSINLFLDGKLKELEKTGYLSGIQSLPERFSKAKFNGKVKSTGIPAIMHNSSLTAKDICYEYRQRGETEQFFDRLKNKLYIVLKHTPLNKTQKPNHKYSITDTVEHLKKEQSVFCEKQRYVIC